MFFCIQGDDIDHALIPSLIPRCSNGLGCLDSECQAMDQALGRCFALLPARQHAEQLNALQSVSIHLQPMKTSTCFG